MTQLLVAARYFSLLQRVQTGSGAQRAYYFMTSEWFSPQGVSCCSIELTTPLYLAQRIRMYGNTPTLSHHCHTCFHGPHKDKFTFFIFYIFYLSPLFLLSSHGLSRSHIPTLTLFPFLKKFSYQGVNREGQRMIHYSNTCATIVVL